MWTFKLSIHAHSLDAIKSVMTQAAKQVANAKVPADLSMNWASNGGPGTDMGCSSEYTCPMEDHIRELRRRADCLEAELRAKH